MKFILGYKKNMTQTYREDGTVVPVTVVQADRCVVTQIKSQDKDGYSAIQLGVGAKKKLGKTMKGHLSALIKKDQKGFSDMKELRIEDSAQFNVGDIIDVTMFEPGDVVTVTGTSKGKGFQGVVKRHGFHGSPASHGHKDQLRMPGSIGSQEPQRVFKGTRMAGRMGGDRVTVKNLEVVNIDPENHLLYVKGALPGSRNSMVVLVGEGDSKISHNVLKDEPKKEEPAKEDVAVQNPEQKEDEPKEEVKQPKEDVAAQNPEPKDTVDEQKEEPKKDDAS